jgi:hypothetical protein
MSADEQDDLHVVNDYPGTPRWSWRVEGTETPSSPCARRHSFDETGVIRAEGAGEALDWLVTHGPMWDGLDTDDAFTITITPDDDPWPAVERLTGPEQQRRAVQAAAERAMDIIDRAVTEGRLPG